MAYDNYVSVSDLEREVMTRISKVLAQTRNRIAKILDEYDADRVGEQLHVEVSFIAAVSASEETAKAFTDKIVHRAAWELEEEEETEETVELSQPRFSAPMYG